MTDDRDKLLQVMNSLEADYNSGKISAEKYTYFRSKYEDKLNSIDAMEATRRIRSMQGKSIPMSNLNENNNPISNKKKQEQDLVQKYIINPKKDDAKYNKQKNSSMGSGTFRLIAILVLVIAFTVGVAYGIFNLDTESISDTNVVATVEDTAFPEIVTVINTTNMTVDNNTSNNTNVDDNNDDEKTIETTREQTTTTKPTSSTPSETPSQDTPSESTPSTPSETPSDPSPSTPSETPSESGGEDN